MDTEVLQEIGLNTTEIKVYLALLELGSALAGEITKKSKINRTNVYDSLEKLIDKGLVVYSMSANRKVFESVGPHQLKEILKERQNKLDILMPELEEVYKKTKSKEESLTFRGKKGIKSLFEDVLKDKKDLFVYGAESKFADIFPAYQKYWNKRRAEEKIKVQIIYNEKIRKLKQKENLKLISMKFLPVDYDFPATTMFYGDKTTIIVWAEDPVGFLIKSEEITKSNLNFFKILWRVAKK